METIHAELVRLATEMEAASANRVQRTTRHLSTDHYSHVKFSSSARQEAEPQGSWEALTTAIEWKPPRIW